MALFPLLVSFPTGFWFSRFFPLHFCFRVLVLLKLSEYGLLFCCLELALVVFALLWGWNMISARLRITAKLRAPASCLLQMLGHRYSVLVSVLLQCCGWYRVAERLRIMAASYSVSVSPRTLAAHGDRSEVYRWACLTCRELPRPVFIKNRGEVVSRAAFVTIRFCTGLKSRFKLNLSLNLDVSFSFVTTLVTSWVSCTHNVLICCLSKESLV